MKATIYLTAILMLISSSLFAKSDIDEIKLGIYAKDLKVIYTGLTSFLGEDVSETPIEKWIELGDAMSEIQDYSSAWQFYMLASVAVFQNDKISKIEKAEKYKLLTNKSEDMLKKANAGEQLIIQKNKYAIIPGKINLLNNLAILLKNTEKILFSPNASKVSGVAVEAKAIEDPNASRGNFANQLQLEQPNYDEAPYYDYYDIINNLVYPQRAKEEGIEGKVLLELLIDEKGNIEEKKVLESSRNLFNNAALAVVDYVKFTPAKKSGIATKSKIVVPIHFEINR